MGWIEDEIIPAMWVIKVRETNSLGNSYKSGVLLKNNRILTCFHSFENNDSIITARMLNEDGFQHKMKIAYKREDWDLALLEFEVDPGQKYKYLELSDDEVLTLDDKVHCLGIEGSRQGVCAAGPLLKPCVPIHHSTFKNPIEKCKIPEEEDCRTRHALMRDLQFANRGQEPNYLNRHPDLPLILVRMSTGPGFCGGPYFRYDRKIVGIEICSNGYEAIGVHLSALKEFVKEADENVSGASTSN